jgi:hypothetical protein
LITIKNTLIINKLIKNNLPSNHNNNINRVVSLNKQLLDIPLLFINRIPNYHSFKKYYFRQNQSLNSINNQPKKNNQFNNHNRKLFIRIQITNKKFCHQFLNNINHKGIVKLWISSIWVINKGIAKHFKTFNKNKVKRKTFCKLYKPNNHQKLLF